ncbi:hypothetical protein BDZ89DRAFT_955044 [Hymenopellis radicata]|nr:hypothetical protein BDZ89DRAFT_955044 [Hymenopellis radicata]
MKPLPYNIGEESTPQSRQSPGPQPKSKVSTPRPPESSTPAQRSPDGTRPLNVTDALSYLDAVKVQFQDKPEVYNRFLDIMKDFKGQVIDTPGVIQRVSRLFHGNPVLIQGFNTFLPVGYRIEVSVDPADPNTITVTTPTGTVTQSTNGFQQLPRPPPPSSDIPGFGPNLAHPLPYPPGVALPPLGSGTLSRSMTPQAFHQPSQVGPPFDGFNSPFHPNASTSAAAILGGLNKRHTDPQPQGNTDFYHAIQYLNKIKARYNEDPNMYKRFLDILQAHQKEPKIPASESPVYAQVLTLFQDAPDLLTEFKDFLPEAGNQGMVASGTATGPPSSWNVPPETSSSPDKVPKKPAPTLKRKKRVPEKDVTPVPPAKPAPSSRVKKAKHHHKEPGSPSFSPYAGPSPQPAHAHAHTHTSSAILPPPPVPHSHAMQPPASTQSLSVATPSGSDNKLLFFDRAKKALENREIYEEFLKLLSLFSKDILDLRTLIDRSRAFLGDSDLMAEFKELVGWDSKQESSENGPPGSIRTGPPEALSALPVDDGEGPSYRRLPESEVRLACSGRDELCRSVLNDAWVSHPTWASEEAGFQTHKKNSFEEALHRCEEERHEYHVQLQALTATIAHLEPLYARIEEMSNEERATFRLKPNLGGPGRGLYERIIKRIYGREASVEVLKALQEYPANTVPVVLSRLKIKDEEWRRAQREWSRTWREVDSKNFYKSLDHQGISFKVNDKKNITAKHFVADIEAVKLEQQTMHEHDPIPASARGSPESQFDYAFQDTSVLHDSLKMVFSFLDRSQGTYTPQERRGVESFLRTFVPALFMYPQAEFSDACGPFDNVQDEEQDLERGGRRSSGSPHSSYVNGVRPIDLRKKLLKTAQERASGDATRSASAMGSRAVSPGGMSRPSPSPRPEERKNDFGNDIWIKETVATGSFTDNVAYDADSERPFFANTTFYTLLRLLQLLYSRLLMCKEIGQALAAQKHAELLANPVAVELGLDDPNGPATLLKQTMDILSERAKDDTNVVYMYLLDACEKVFANELDQVSFEEHMRWFFGNKAYHLFTLDKLITALVKQVQTILLDSKCQELWSLLQSVQQTGVITNQDVIRYRREAERHVQDDYLYRLQWVRESKTIKVQLMTPQDPSTNGAPTAGNRWREYIASYVMRHPTEWAEKQGERHNAKVFLSRYLSTRQSDSTTAVSEGLMSIRISPSTYKLVYERDLRKWCGGK